MSVLLLVALLGAPPMAEARPPAERGVCLGLFSADPHFRYRGLLEEIAATGASHVAITWVAWQEDLRAEVIAPRPGWSATPEQIDRAIRDANALGLKVTALPIVRLAKAGPKEWRGVIQPTNEDRWWASYEDFIVSGARLAQAAGAQRYSVGSELLSREGMRERWLGLIRRVREAAPSLELMYSANWDHFDGVSFWDAVDVAGVTAYFELTRRLDPEVEELVSAWAPARAALLGLGRRIQRPLIISEIGYPSLDGGVAWPWDETRKAQVDLEEQRRAYVAVVQAWSNTDELRGLYFWNWFGFGGPDDGNYTPRGKPAAAVLREWYRTPITRPGDLRR